jgi:hypothetical protein
MLLIPVSPKSACKRAKKAIPFGLVAKASPAHRKVMIGYLQLEAEFVRIGIAAMLSDINQKRGKRTITIG